MAKDLWLFLGQSFVLFVVVSGQQVHVCHRKCQQGAPPMVCYYKVQLQLFRTMSKACYDCPRNLTDCYRKDCIAADGTDKMIFSVNKKLPAPSIEVCYNDTIVVDAENHFPGHSTTLHWHGIRMKRTPYMDGVPMVTQCPILPYTTFRYEFTPEESGTFWWHSHLACQRDGVYGALIIRKPKELDPLGHLYDYDNHVIVIQDWFKRGCNDRVSYIEYSYSSLDEHTLLVNGQGMYVKFKKGNEEVYTPPSRFVVKQGYRYRFRVIYNGLLQCPVEVSVDNHKMIMISSDSQDIKPVEASSFVIYSGERWDFVLEANQSVGLYWIKFRGLLYCYDPEDGTESFQVAVLQYKGASATKLPEGKVTYSNATVKGVQVNGLNSILEDKTSIPVTKLETIEPWDDRLKEVPDIQLYIDDDTYKKDNVHYHVRRRYGYYQVNPLKRNISPQLNHIAFIFPPIPLLPERYNTTDSMFCNATTVAGMDCKHNFCECTHVIQVPLNAVVELVMVNQATFNYNESHPFHLHGNFFRVVASGRLHPNNTIEDVKKLDAAGKIKRNLKTAPIKDTVSDVGGGFVIIRWKADNPGYWLFHCHIEVHFEEGMGLVYKVGNNDDMVPIPPNFPTCGNYLPPIP